MLEVRVGDIYTNYDGDVILLVTEVDYANDHAGYEESGYFKRSGSYNFDRFELFKTLKYIGKL